MEILAQVNCLANSQTNILTDGKLTCSYQDIPEIFDGLQSYFALQGIDTDACLALECENSLPDALILLYLLEKGYSFLLLPKVKTPLVLAQSQYIPRFCRYRVITQNLTSNGSVFDLRSSHQLCHLVENDQWIGNYSQSNNAYQKLYLQTSGSTGNPKIVVHDVSKLLDNARNCIKRLSLHRNDRIAVPVPIAHMYGLGAAFLPAMMARASIDLQQGANLIRYLQRERVFNPNIAFMTPTFCQTLLKGRRSKRQYKLTVAAGDRFRSDSFAHYESRFGCLVSLYGSTEMGAIAAADPKDPFELRAQTVGQPMPGVELRLEAQPIESAASIEGVGTLWCRHDYGFEGYVDESGKLYSQLNHGDWFCTNDLARMRTDGCIEVLGRGDHSVNRNGLLVFLTEIEQAMEAITDIEQVIVVTQGDRPRGQGITAYCILAKGAKMTETEIRAACFRLLPRHAIPDLIAIVSSLPRLPTGKVDRQKLISRTEVTLNRQ